MSKTTISQQEIRQLVVARLRSMAPNRKIAIGSSGSFTKDELIERVEKKDAMGKKIVEIQLAYLQSHKKSLVS